MRIFLPLDFARRAAKQKVTDDDLREAVARAERDLIDAQLGLALIKHRIPRAGQGRSGGFRSIIVYERGRIAIFLHLFAKNTKANLTKTETQVFRDLAATLIGLSDEALRQVAATQGWRRIDDDGTEDDQSQ
ncbi:type II toxin-antitoxin system RelE/ParE family toxin [Methylobacterium sp. J-048]|uniref:type II toxin-antitoxin system RelE/ParE family toxin n=1 Tax=Methylobacterium sp. J-048 TaxID=2836635 RepID=UPI001FB91AFC|nr:type II toxin-antitoxin system RelE/ParE family toxin [Methylobacterium sp. J-048]MCJ2059538.1 type II toxin-antitoxin system RelE/ParE family toxin [Methylobacterium sp. J-048]